MSDEALGKMRRAVIAFGLVSVLGAPAAALAQSAGGQAASGWTYNVQPYVWLPAMKATINYDLPNASGSASTVANPGDYIRDLNFAGMVEAGARYGNYSLLTDLIYVNANARDSKTFSRDFILPHDRPGASATLDTSSRISSTVWGLAGGYTLAGGNWGNVDALVGMRMLSASSTTNFSSTVSVTGPRGNTATVFGPGGSLSTTETIWNRNGSMSGHSLWSAMAASSSGLSAKCARPFSRKPATPVSD